MNNKKYNNIGLNIFIIVFSISSMLLMAYNTSPLIDKIGLDSGMYLIIGKYLLKGRILYVDFFDHKGPIIFFINSLPQLFIRGELGVWILETTCMIISAELIYKISKKILKNNLAIIFPIAYIILSIVFMNGGNYSEEYANLFNIICINILVDFEINSPRKITSKQAATLGICIAFNFFLKPNIALFSICIWLFIFTHIIRSKKKDIIKYVIYSILGALIITVPIIIFCVIQNNLYEMLDAMILHNIK